MVVPSPVATLDAALGPRPAFAVSPNPTEGLPLLTQLPEDPSPMESASGPVPEPLAQPPCPLPPKEFDLFLLSLLICLAFFTPLCDSFVYFYYWVF